MDKLLGLLSLCRRAGKLTMGFDAVCEASAKGSAALVLTASDLSEGSARRLAQKLSPAEAVRLELTISELSRITGKAVGILAVCEPNLASQISLLLASGQKEQDRPE